MAILQITTDYAGEVGVLPRKVRILATDALSVVTTAGYLNGARAEGYTFYPSDVFDIVYGYNQSTGVGTYSVFTCTISSVGVIALVLDVSEGNVLLPVVSGNVSVFNGTTGQIKDSGLAPSSTTSQLYAATSPGSLTSGNLLKTSDTHGTLADSGIVPANVMLLDATNTVSGRIIYSKVTGPESGNAITLNGSCGVITTSALTTAGGATYSINWTNSAIQTTNVVLLSLWDGSNNATFNYSAQCTPGVGSATITISNNTAATALNGTVKIGFLVI
jgi:hypothetical protein